MPNKGEEIVPIRHRNSTPVKRLLSSDDAVIKWLIAEAVNLVSKRFEQYEQKPLQEISVRGNGGEEIWHSVLALQNVRMQGENKIKSFTSHSQDVMESRVPAFDTLMGGEGSKRIMEHCVTGYFSNSISDSNYQECPSVAARALKTIHSWKWPSEKRDRFKGKDGAEHSNLRLGALLTKVRAYNQSNLDVF